MVKIQNPNIEIVTRAVEQLGEVADEMVFLGGCATGLLITDQAAPPIRQTIDVDTIVQVSSRGEYYQLSDALREKGFREDTSDDAPLCRWRGDVVILDVMPTDESILGFANKWYVSAMEHAKEISLPSGQTIKMVSAPYFLITKLEAFDGRGEGDYQMSHDMEDIIAVLDGRVEIIADVDSADKKLRKELSQRFVELRHDDRFIQSIPGHMPPDAGSQLRVSHVRDVINAIAKIIR